MVVQRKNKRTGPPPDFGPRAFAGWAEYRFGTTSKRQPALPSIALDKRIKSRVVMPPPVKKDNAFWKVSPRLDVPIRLHNPAVAEKELDAVVKRTAEQLRDWQFNPWEKESAVLEGLRSAILQKNWSFAEAEAEALDIIRRAFNLLGRGIETRPSVQEGQAGYTIPRENCQNCFGPLDEADMAAGAAFCSHDCRVMARAKNQHFYTWVHNLELGRARTQLLYETGPLRDCALPTCDLQFRSPDPNQQFCSPECFHESRRDRILKQCANPNCSNEFETKPSKDQKFCCDKCRREGTPLLLDPRMCALETCHNEFQPTDPRQKFCCTAHAVKDSERRKARERPPLFPPKRCECEGCNEVFHPTRARGRFCSPQCRDRQSSREKYRRRKTARG